MDDIFYHAELSCNQTLTPLGVQAKYCQLICSLVGYEIPKPYKYKKKSV